MKFLKRIARLFTSVPAGTWPLMLAALGTPVIEAQIPAPQINLTGNIGCQGFPCVNNGTLIMPSDANYSLSAQETSAMSIKVTSSVSLTATRNLIWPAGNFPVDVENSTTGGQAIQVVGASGTGVTITNGQTVRVWNDGTNFVTVGAAGSSGVNQIIAGTNVTVSPGGGTGVVTINATGGGGCALGTCVQNTASVDQNVVQSTGTALNVQHLAIVNNELLNGKASNFLSNGASEDTIIHGGEPEALADLLQVPLGSRTINAIGSASLVDMHSCASTGCSHSTSPGQDGTLPVTFPLGVTSNTKSQLGFGFNDLSNIGASPTAANLDYFHGQELAWGLLYATTDTQKLSVANCTLTGTWVTIGGSGWPAGAMKATADGSTATCVLPPATDAGIISYKSVGSDGVWTATVTEAGVTYPVTDSYLKTSTIDQVSGTYTSAWGGTSDLWAIGVSGLPGGTPTLVMTCTHAGTDGCVFAAPYAIAPSGTLQNSPALLIKLTLLQCNNGTCSGAISGHSDAQINLMRNEQLKAANELRANGLNVTVFDGDGAPQGMNPNNVGDTGGVSTFTVTAGGSGYANGNVTFSGGGCTTLPTAAASPLSGGVITTGTYFVSSPGVCTSTATVVFGGGGSGAAGVGNYVSDVHPNTAGAAKIAAAGFTSLNGAVSASDKLSPRSTSSCDLSAGNNNQFCVSIAGQQMNMLGVYLGFGAGGPSGTFTMNRDPSTGTIIDSTQGAFQLQHVARSTTPANDTWALESYPSTGGFTPSALPFGWNTAGQVTVGNTAFILNFCGTALFNIGNCIMSVLPNGQAGFGILPTHAGDFAQNSSVISLTTANIAELAVINTNGTTVNSYEDFAAQSYNSAASPVQMSDIATVNVALGAGAESGDMHFITRNGGTPTDWMELSHLGTLGPSTGGAWSLTNAGALTVASCSGCGAGGGATLQTNTVNNASQTLLNFTTSTTNTTGLTVTPSNPSGGVEKMEITGTIAAANVATLNQNTSGTAANLSGTPALPNGTTATTQTVGDNTTKLATDAFVIANAGGTPAFNAITSGTNTTAAMLVGTGASLNPTGAGVVNSNYLNGAAIPTVGGPTTTTAGGTLINLKQISQLFGAGTSFVYGSGATLPGQTSAFALIARDTPAAIITNTGIPGARAWQIANDVFAKYEASPVLPSACILDGVQNDALDNLDQVGFKNELDAYISWCAIPFTFRQYASTATKTGTWTADVTLPILNSTTTTYTSPGTAQKSTVSGSTLTFSVPTSASTAIGITTTQTNTQTGTYTVNIDGTNVTDDCSSSTTFSSAPCVALTPGPSTFYRQRYTVTGGTTHTVIITTTNAANSGIVSVDWMPPATTTTLSPAIFWGSTANYTNFAAYNSVASGLITQLATDGLPVTYVDLIAGGVNTTTDQTTSASATCPGSAVTLHPNDCGNVKIATLTQAAEATLNYVYSTYQAGGVMPTAGISQVPLQTYASANVLQGSPNRLSAYANLNVNNLATGMGIDFFRSTGVAVYGVGTGQDKSTGLPFSNAALVKSYCASAGWFAVQKHDASATYGETHYTTEFAVNCANGNSYQLGSNTATQFITTLGSAALTSATPGTGVTSATCQTAACTVSRGTYTVVGGTGTTGTVVTLLWPTTTTAWACSVVENGGTGFQGLGHSVATATGMNITAGITVLGVTFTFDYSCQP